MRVSMTKIVTATAAVQLAERGALSLDDAVDRHLPWFRQGRAEPPVTVRHLLNHTAGLGNPLPLRWIHRADAPTPPSHEFAVRVLSRRRLRALRPGGRARYSNPGYIALGEVIHHASGEPYTEYVRRNILHPLGMHSTGFGYGDVPEELVAHGHHPRRHPMSPLLRALLPAGIVGPTTERWLILERFLVDGAAYGGLVGPASDAVRFLAMHLNDGTYKGVRVLSPESAREMRQLRASGRQLDVGLGWFRRRGALRRDYDHVEHLGGGAGFWNMMRLYPEHGIGVLAMGNSTRYDHELVARVLGPRESSPE